jgi:carbonic anhydrase/acetyltransferase-like protein (isoleucine patch superfamily)
LQQYVENKQVELVQDVQVDHNVPQDTVPLRKVIEPGMLVGGVPAKVIRRLSSENIERAKEGALQYLDNGALYKKTSSNDL